MPRLLISSGGELRQLAFVDVLHDGSLTLALVRKGTSKGGFEWELRGSESGPLEQRDEEAPATKNITIHTSGRVNYHFNRCPPRFLPCLLDLEQAELLLNYEIPSVSRLDKVAASRRDDYVLNVPDVHVGPITFGFHALPLPLAVLEGEVGRFGVEGVYGLAWTAAFGSAFRRDDVPTDAFITGRPGEARLAAQAVPEEVAYLRFRRTMYARDVIAAVEASPDRDRITREHIEAALQRGPGLYPPNGDGVWTVVTAVPKRAPPRLEVRFTDPRFRAEVVDLRPGDTRLATVRVRFKVFDEVRQCFVKDIVQIIDVRLSAEL